MNAIQDIADWIINNQIKKKGRPHHGATVIKKHDPLFEIRMPIYINIAMQLMTQRFATDEPGCVAARARLTELSLSIGTLVNEQMDSQTDSKFDLLPLGDLIISGFLNLEYVDIARNDAYSEWDGDAPYEVIRLEKFDDLMDLEEKDKALLLRGTTMAPIKDITKMVQGHGRPVIKGYAEFFEQEYLDQLEEAIEEDKPWLAAINKLQQQGWTINQQVLDVLQDNRSSLQVPVVRGTGNGDPKKVEEARQALREKDTPNRRKKLEKESDLWNADRAYLKALSKNAETNLILMKAELLASSGTFYQYIEADYRGRLYYQEPLMNFQGPDIARGLMLFSDGEEFTDDGLKWLAIHTAASYNETFHKDDIPSWATYDYKTMLEEQGLETISVDKMTLDDRVAWFNANVDMVLDSADKIIKCEKPISFLACAIEWNNYYNGAELSYLPIPIDGTCNGYQHSGAIAKDEKTGDMVALTSQEVPKDLYVAAAQALVAKRPNCRILKAMSMKEIRKGIAKRGTMTRGYSCGKKTMAENMEVDCYTEGLTAKYNMNFLDFESLASDLYDVIGEVCPGATKTMNFLQELATYELGTFKTYDADNKVVSPAKKKKLHQRKQELKKIKEPTEEQYKELEDIEMTLNEYITKCVKGNGTYKYLQWTTPTGFPVMYEAYVTKKLRVRSSIPGFIKEGSEVKDSNQQQRIRHVLQEKNENMPDIRKFQSGVSPNFIHSLDAAHMSAVINNWNGNFGAVHDSFSTHAANVEELAALTRETFVDFYNVDNTYEVIADMILSSGAWMADIEYPEQGELDIEEVLDSQYFFC